MKGFLRLALGACIVTSLFAQAKPEQPSLSFGMSEISLGMTLEEVNKVLSSSGRHLQFLLKDKEDALVIGPAGDEGQITFSEGRTIYAAYQMPNVSSADELTQEIAGAVDSMPTKTCSAHNYSAHGTGGGFNQTIFRCGSRTFFVMNSNEFGSSARSVNVTIEIGSPATK